MTDARQMRDTVRQSARKYAIDRYCAALFAPKAARADLIALAAFTGEIDHIVRSASDAALGEIRLQWWRECLISAVEGVRSGHPVLDAFAAVVRHRSLPMADLDRFMDARADDLVVAPPSDEAKFDAHLTRVDGIPLTLAARLLGIDPGAAGGGPILELAAPALGRSRVACELPYFLARGTSPLPPAGTPGNPESVAAWRAEIGRLGCEADARLRRLRSEFTCADNDLWKPLLPLALIEPYFAALQKRNFDPTRDLVEIAPIARLWHLARAYLVGRL